MRRYLPLLILVIGLAAVLIDFVPGLSLPLVTNPNNTAPLQTKLGLDLQGGAQLEYKAVLPAGQKPQPGDMNVIKSIMENRVNSQGVSEPVVETQGDDRVVVQLPGNVNFDAIRQLVGQTGSLEFVDLPAAQYGTQTAPGTKAVPGQGQAIDPTLPALIGGRDLDTSKLSVGYNATDGWTVNFGFKSDAANKFAAYTAANVNHFFAIVLDGKVVSAPYIKGAITGGQGQISGNFTSQSAKDLVTVLQYGALPFPVQEIGNSQIPATLGSQFLNQTLLAGAIGIGLVLLFMLIYYRLPGLIANLALAYYALVVLALFRIFPVTLTLAGIAGFVLSVGMAVDANILIFERTKEELRLGKTLPAAIEAGFNRAWNSILDSNVSSLITASILYFGGSSVIKGFALVLIIGVLTSMFTAVTVSRTLLRLVVQRQWARKAWLYGVTDAEFQARSIPGRGSRREAASRV